METNQATEYMVQVHACSEAVPLAVCKEFKIEIDGRIFPGITSLFAGEIGNTGAVCGAVTGANTFRAGRWIQYNR